MSANIQIYCYACRAVRPASENRMTWRCDRCFSDFVDEVREEIPDLTARDHPFGIQPGMGPVTDPVTSEAPARRRGGRSTRTYHQRGPSIILPDGTITKAVVNGDMATAVFKSELERRNAAIVPEVILSNNADNCAICLDPPTEFNMAWVNRCHHTFHEHCIRKWVIERDTCPLCNRCIVPRLTLMN